jgi:hypothetical protein
MPVPEGYSMRRATDEATPPVVLGACREGKQAFLHRRSEAIAEWLGGRAAVCLVDVRGTGETRPRDGSRRHNGTSAAPSEAEWMLGQILVGSRLKDVRSVLRHLRTRADFDSGRVALWGDSFAPANPGVRPWPSPWMPTGSPARPSRSGACSPSSRPCSTTASAPFTCEGA